MTAAVINLLWLNNMTRKQVHHLTNKGGEFQGFCDSRSPLLHGSYIKK